MSGRIDVVRAWKDADYRAALSAEERALLPANPAGEIELNDAELDGVSGGAMTTERLLTLGCCGGLTSDDGFCSFFCGSEDCIYPTTSDSRGCTGQ